jgi:hypothetical protein
MNEEIYIIICLKSVFAPIKNNSNISRFVFISKMVHGLEKNTLLKKKQTKQNCFFYLMIVSKQTKLCSSRSPLYYTSLTGIIIFF